MWGSEVFDINGITLDLSLIEVLDGIMEVRTCVRM